MRFAATVFLLLSATVIYCSCEQYYLTPPFFNLATVAKIQASSTCGLNDEGSPIKDIYCILPNGQCDYCNSNVAENMLDNTNTFWQSRPLSRGLEHQQVNLTITFPQAFEIGYISIRMAHSSRPAVWVLERSEDFGRTYQPWRYFARNTEECLTHFGINSDVECDITQSKVVPLENGQIFQKLVPEAEVGIPKGRVLDHATNIRLRFLSPSILRGHKQLVSDQNPAYTKYYFYSVREIEIGGRCSCNGQCGSCVVDDKTSLYNCSNCNNKNGSFYKGHFQKN